MFYLSAYVMDVFCATFPFPTMGWNWTKVGPPVHIYCSTLWEDNFIPIVYDISDNFLGYIYQKIFKEYAPTFSFKSKVLSYTMGDWYVGYAGYMGYLFISF